MAEKLEDWLSGEVAELSKMPIGELSNTFFFRDPIRPTQHRSRTLLQAQLMVLFYIKKWFYLESKYLK